MAPHTWNVSTITNPSVYTWIIQPLLQEQFVKLVAIRDESKEQVKYKCWAGWASEDKMRDTLKIKEWASQCYISSMQGMIGKSNHMFRSKKKLLFPKWTSFDCSPSPLRSRITAIKNFCSQREGFTKRLSLAFIIA